MKTNRHSAQRVPVLSRIAFGLLLFAFIIGCQPQLPEITPLPNTATSTQTETPQPTLTPTPTLMYQENSISFENPGIWNFSKPYTFEDWPDLIVPNGDVYKLTENYEIQSIELSYQWWGLGDAGFDYQQIEKTGNDYLLDGRVVSRELIIGLLNSINNLHLSPQTLSSITHTDDYPIWAIEITGVDGTKLLLYSTSNTASYAPWNLIYNGAIYVQFDGSIAVALAELFAVEEGQPMAAFYPGGVEEGKLMVSSNGWPNQLIYGFNGLLPLHTAFNYRVDAATGEIIGLIDGRSSIGGFGNMIIGSITKLEKIVLEKSDKTLIKCPFESVENKDDPSAIQWSFNCLVTDPTEGPYQYVVKVTFGTDQGERITSQGNLFGNWGKTTLLPKTPFPPEIAEALATSDKYQALAKTHQILLLSWDAKVDQSVGRLDESINADVVLLGQVNFNGRELPYSLTTSMGIENSKVTRWDIDVVELQSLLTDVLNQRITKNLLDNAENPVLNLYYFEDNDIVDVGDFEGMTFAGRKSFWLAKCNGFPWKKNLPDGDTPLREFSVNGGWKSSDAQMVLFEKEVRLFDYYGYTSGDKKNPMSYLLPHELILPGKSPLEIRAHFTYGSFIYLVWANDASQEDIATYMEMIKKLPGTKEYFSWGVSIEGAIFAVNKEGSLDFVSCGK